PGTIGACSTGDEMAAELRDADVLMATHCDPRSVVESPTLRWVQSLASGVEDWFRPPGPPACPITRMTGVFERYMAEYVFAHLLARTQELARLSEAQRAREWAPFDTISLKGKVLGLAGVGHVGAAVAGRAAAFERRVRGLSRNGSPVAGIERVYRREERDDFLRGLDVLVLAMPLTDATRGFLDAAAVAALPPTAVVVNIGRGG